jgi:3-methyladenine DNA glycosylase/8-oxoguanine DNA glycosylase
LPPALESSPTRYRRGVRLGNRVVEILLHADDEMLVVESAERLAKREAQRVNAVVSRMFRLEDDLSGFYALIAADPQLSWAANGAGRMLASPTVFEDVIKTICTTNCAWSATLRMTAALCELGGGDFPSPDMLARTPPRWYRDAARMGYRGEYVRAIARNAAEGALDLESLLPRAGQPDEAVETALLALPGIGPYGAAHVMQLLGRHRRLVLDSWTRPTYLRLSGKKRAADATMRRAFARYGAYAGLAFWLYLTRGWLDGACPTG